MLKINDIAKHVGVSATTVSLVLNEGPGSARFSEKTRLQVLQAAEELGYRSNRMARAMRTGNTRMLGILGGKPSEEHVGKMLEGALEAADAHGYTLKLLRLQTFSDSAQLAIRSVSELRLMGILALHLPDAILEELSIESAKCGTPLVLMDTHSLNFDIPQVASNDEAGFELGIEYLVKWGHSKIALINGGGETAIGLSRRNAFKRALARQGLVFDAQFCREGSFHRKEPSEEAARWLLARPVAKRPTAIFCSSDFMALSVLKVAQELRIHVPTELSVMGFANMKVAEYASPALTTIAQPFAEMGRAAAEMLLQIIDEREAQDGSIPPQPQSNLQEPHQLKLFPTRLIERDSVAAPFA